MHVRLCDRESIQALENNSPTDVCISIRVVIVPRSLHSPSYNQSYRAANIDVPNYVTRMANEMTNKLRSYVQNSFFDTTTMSYYLSHCV